MLTPRQRTRSRYLGPAVVALIVLIGACGDDPENPVAEPEPTENIAAPGGFDDLPRPVSSEPVGPRNDADGGVARRYEVRGTTPREVMAFYTDALKADGWVPVGAVEELGLDSFRGEWTNTPGGQRLQVSAADIPGLGGEEDRAASVLTEFTVSLRPV